jgi:penicillin-binding protein 1A
MTWRQIMAYAHQGIEIKNIPGVPAGPTPPVAQVAATQKSSEPSAPRPTMLTKRSMDVLLRVERMMDEASRALADVRTTQQGAELRTQDAVASAEAGSRGN